MILKENVVSWRKKVANEVVLRRVGQQRSLLAELRKGQMNFLGHVLRNEKIEHLCLTGMMEGRRARGRQRVKYLDTILEDMGGGMTRNQLLELARDREMETKYRPCLRHSILCRLL